MPVRTFALALSLALVAPCFGAIHSTQQNLRVQKLIETPSVAPNALTADFSKIAMPPSLVAMGHDCNCHFKDLCTCEATLEFMNCIYAACESGSCACGGATHVNLACGNMSATCPNVNLQCGAEKATCAMGATEEKPKEEAKEADPLKSAKEAILNPPAIEASGDAAAAAVKDANEATEPVTKTWKHWTQEKPLVLQFFSIIPFLVAAYIYNRYRQTADFRQQLSFLTPDGFSYSLFGCFEDKRICCLSFCLGPIRWADTMDKTNPSLMRYWTAIAIYVVIMFVSPWAGALGGCVLLALCTVFRQKLRAQLGIKSGTPWTMLEDCCTYTWCSPCAIAQEARQVESINKS